MRINCSTHADALMKTTAWVDESFRMFFKPNRRHLLFLPIYKQKSCTSELAQLFIIVQQQGKIILPHYNQVHSSCLP